MYTFVRHKGLTINQDFLDILARCRLDDFCLLRDYEGGGLFKKNRYRSVVRIEAGEGSSQKVFYLKRHFWPLKERIKYLLPWSVIEDAGNEWNNMLVLEESGFHTMVPVAFGEEKRFGIPRFSLTLTEKIPDAEKLEEYLPKRFSPPLTGPLLEEKRECVRKIARFAGEFHGKGLNHQDFYLGHMFLRPGDGGLFIIDIQRVHRRETISLHSRVKDLAQLLFSAQGLCIFTRSDFMRFAHSYFNTGRLSATDKKMVREVLAKAKKIGKHTEKLLERRKRKP